MVVVVIIVVRPNTFFAQKNFGSKKLWVQKTWPKKNFKKTIFWFKNFFVQKKGWCNLGKQNVSKKIGKTIFGQNNFGSEKDNG